MYILLVQNITKPYDATFYKCSSITYAEQIKSQYDSHSYSFELISDFKLITF